MATRRIWKTIAAAGCGASLAPLDTAVNIAFPAITQAFALPVATIQWIVICYILSYGSLLLNCGRWADIRGHRRVFLSGVAISALALACCALAPAYHWLLLFRVIQGIGSALVLATGPALITLTFPPDQRSRAVAIYNLTFALAFALGPLIGGLIIERWGWPAVFWFRLPLALIALALGARWLQDTTRPADRQDFDGIGAATLTLTIVCTLLSIHQAGSHGVSLILLSGVGGAAVSLYLFVQRQRTGRQPLIDPGLFRRRDFVAANLAHALAQLAGFTVLLLCPYYLVAVFEQDVTWAGFVLSLSPLGMMLAAPVSGRLLTGYRADQVCRAGAGVLCIGLLIIALWSRQSPLALIACGLLIQGFGLGLFQTASMDLVMATLPRDSQGVAGALVMLMRTLGAVSGASLGLLLFAALLAGESGHSITANDAFAGASGAMFIMAFQSTFQVAAMVSALAWLLLWWGRRSAMSAGN
jgi:EmrB/QacA subfamily drug resistance transporter